MPHQLEKFITSDDPELLKGDAELQQQWREKTLDRAGATGVAIPRAELATHLDRIIGSLGR